MPNFWGSQSIFKNKIDLQRHNRDTCHYVGMCTNVKKLHKNGKSCQEKYTRTYNILIESWGISST